MSGHNSESASSGKAFMDLVALRESHPPACQALCQFMRASSASLHAQEAC